MIDLRPTIEPKSDQLNADCLLSGPMTIRVTEVSLNDSSDQPVAIHYEGDNGRPFKPCKSMRRVLVKAWGADGHKYIGKSMTLFCDPDVTFGGSKVGGIRISHVSDIERPFAMALTTTRSKRSQYSVQPLIVSKSAHPPVASNVEQEARNAAAKGMAALKTFWESIPGKQKRALQTLMDDLKKVAVRVDEDAAGQEEASEPKPSDANSSNHDDYGDF